MNVTEYSDIILSTHSFCEHMFPAPCRLNTVPVAGAGQLNLVMRKLQEGGGEGPERVS